MIIFTSKARPRAIHMEKKLACIAVLVKYNRAEKGQFSRASVLKPLLKRNQVVVRWKYRIRGRVPEFTSKV